MKIVRYITLFLVILLPLHSNARTIGNNIGIGSGSLKLKSNENQMLHKSDAAKNAYLHTFYKYNWNIDDFIVAVEFFYDYINIKSFVDNSNTIHLKYRAGVNLNIGYDIMEDISIYTIIGLGVVKYRAINTSKDYFDKKDEAKFKGLFGFGIGYDLTDTWKINVEYSHQNININFYENNGAYKFKNNINSIKTSLIYKF